MKTLVVGGTGMLLGLVRELLAAGDEVWMLARHAPALTHPRLHPLLADYQDAAALRAALASAAPFDRAVAWLCGAGHARRGGGLCARATRLTLLHPNSKNPR